MPLTPRARRRPSASRTSRPSRRRRSEPRVMPATAARATDRCAGRAAELAAEALQLAAVRPGRAHSTSSTAERAAREEHDWAAVSVALRAAGVAALHLRRLDEATARLRASADAARRAGDRQLRGEAHMSLA